MSNPINYKLLYNFQNKDVRDYIYKTKIDIGNKIEITTIKQNTKTDTKTTLISPITFTISSLPPIINQGNLGDCVANAFYYCLSKQTNNRILLSRLFLYANCRCIDFTPLNIDSGTTIKTTCKALINYGTCQETVYPYNINNYQQLPPLNAYISSKRFKSFTYNLINQDIHSIKNYLYNYKLPIIFGFIVYSSFISNDVANSGNVPYPKINSENKEGGHCMTIVGYNDITQQFVCANSWGTSWGDKGYCYIPYDYLLNPSLASDFTACNFIY
jgi:C1A family cysteine protease